MLCGSLDGRGAWERKDTYICMEGFPHGSVVKNLPDNTGDSFNPGVGKIPWGRKWQPTPVSLPGKSHGQRSMAGYSPWGHKELDTTQRLNNSRLTV